MVARRSTCGIDVRIRPLHSRLVPAIETWLLSYLCLMVVVMTDASAAAAAKAGRRVAVVTGASRGVGKGVAVALGEAGMIVYGTGRSSGRATYPVLGGTVEETAREVDAAGGLGVAIECDHTDDGQVRALFQRVGQETGRVDLLVNNVWGGYASFHEDRPGDMEAPFWEQPLSIWDDMFAAGVRAHYVASALAVPLMPPGSLIVTISYFVGAYLGPDWVAYSVAKAADDRMIAVMARHLSERGVSAVSLYPGLVRTESVLRAGGLFDLSNSESPMFVGRAVAALAADREIARRSGETLVAAELGVEYGFVDVDGRRPRSIREHYRQR
jgi:dehydrogenase/reductase SDR family member 1